MALPIIHKLHDPNGAKVSRLRKQAIKDLEARIKKVRDEVVPLVESFLDSHLTGTRQINEFTVDKLNPLIVNRTKYLYVVDQLEMSAIDQVIARIVNKWVADGQGLWSPQWYLNQYTRPAYEAGANDSLQSIQNVSPATIVGQELSTEVRSIQIQNLLMQPMYRRPIELLSSRTFNSMEGLSGDMIKDLRFIMSSAVSDGISARDAAKRINAKLWPEKGGYPARALMIARTEINGAYRQAYMEVNDDMNRNVFGDGDFAAKLMHLSALSPTTRRTHAARHGNIYTEDEQAEWWSIDGNSVNCLCSVTTVLVDRETGRPIQQALYKKAQGQGKSFFANK